MKIDEAIEILQTYDKEVDIPPIPDFKDALKLGIEALRCLEGLRNLPYGSPLPPLPSETKE